MTQQTVAEAQAALRNAETTLKQAGVEEAKRQLQNVRTEGHQVKRELDSTLDRWHRAEAEADACVRKLTGLNAAIEQYAAAKPDPVDFPSDQDVERWQRELDRLVAARDRVAVSVREAEHVAGALQVECVKLDKAFAQLQYAHVNAERKVRGEPVAGGWEGGIVRV